VKVYAAEPLNADDCYQSKLKGELTPNPCPPETIADVFTVTEDEIKVRL